MTTNIDWNALLASIRQTTDGSGSGLASLTTKDVKYAGPLALKGSLETDPAYKAYMDSLGTLYGLKDIAPANLN